MKAFGRCWLDSWEDFKPLDTEELSRFLSKLFVLCLLLENTEMSEMEFVIDDDNSSDDVRGDKGQND